MRKTNFPSGTGFWILVIAAILVVGLLAKGLSKRSTRNDSFFCDQCGRRLFVSSEGSPNASGQRQEQRKIETTDLSNWYEAHFGTNCTHNWLTNHTSGATYLTLGELRLWQLVGWSGSFGTPSIIYFLETDRARSEELFSRDPQACKRFISDKLQMKEEVQ